MQPARAGYRRSTGSSRGEARRQDLLERVTDDLAENGLVDFSLRRAARAAGTTHKVLLYHFDSAEDLLNQAVHRLRDRRISHGLAAVNRDGDGRSGDGRSGDGRSGDGHERLSARVRAIWPVLIAVESGARVLDQAIGLAMYDPLHHGELGHGASQQYLPALLSICPAHWSEQRRHEVSSMILATLRGFLVDRATGGEPAGIEAGFAALGRALDREEAADLP